jgi:hypothetical protein
MISFKAQCNFVLQAPDFHVFIHSFIHSFFMHTMHPLFGVDFSTIMSVILTTVSNLDTHLNHSGFAKLFSLLKVCIWMPYLHEMALTTLDSGCTIHAWYRRYSHRYME